MAGDDDTVICKHCGKPIENGQAWHTVAEMHYDCYEKIYGTRSSTCES